MTLAGLKIKFVHLCVNKILVGTKISHFEIKRYLLNSIGYEIGEETKIVGPIFCSGKLVVGKKCWIGKDFSVHGNGKVIIGDNCDIAPEVAFMTGSHLIGESKHRAGEGINSDIKVEDGCWLGARSTILSGVHIGEGCVVASCACVNKNVESNSLVGGVPAKIIRKLNDD